MTNAISRVGSRSQFVCSVSVGGRVCTYISPLKAAQPPRGIDSYLLPGVSNCSMLELAIRRPARILVAWGAAIPPSDGQHRL